MIENDENTKGNGEKERSGHNLQTNKLAETRNDSIDGNNEMKMQIGNEANQELQHPDEEDDGEIEKLMNAWAKKYDGGTVKKQQGEKETIRIRKYSIKPKKKKMMMKNLRN